MSKLRNALAVAMLAALAAASSAQAADIILVNLDGAAEGYNDTTVVAPVGGNPGTTRGQQRQFVAAYAAQLWGSILQSQQPIYIAAQFNPLGPNVLGSAGSQTVHANFTNAPVTNVWYNAALADAISGIDLAPTSFDIGSQYSSDFPFYYGLDDNTPAGQINFLDVVMHEFGHGLGFQNFENEAAGTFLSGRPDIYSVFTYDNTTGKYWTQMTVAERQASALNYGNVVFTGPNAKAGAALILDDRRDFRVTSPAALAGNYAFGTAGFGPAITTGNFNGQVVLGTDSVGTPGDGCEPITSNVSGKIALIDRGVCGFTVKVKNAQNAGAIGVIIADNAPGNPPPALGGADATITIPAMRISQGAGVTFKANLPAQVSFVIDPTKLQGADDQGRPRLFMPNPVQGGSSGSHYDTAAAPNLLMEPAINDSLYSAANLDITPHLLADIGWQINAVGVFPVAPGNAKVGSPSVPDCDTGVPIASQSGMFTGGSIQASNEVCLLSAQTRSGYYSCMDAARDRLVASSLLTTTQGQKMMMCAKRVQSHQQFPIF
jgi:hypothetical protein